MAVQLISAAQALHTLDSFSVVIDARSEDEHALDHLPAALNWPTLNNQERILVGTLYKQQGAFEAKKIGASLAAANISRHIQENVLQLPITWKPLLYCWRGGKRSGSLALILDQIGFKVSLIEGGYKAFRAELVKNIAELAVKIQFKVVCGLTGSGKTRLLHELARQGHQVLDLEALARHRSSVLGLMPGDHQPSQKAFDTAIWDVLRQLDLSRPVFVESESKKVGNVAIPEALMEAIRQSPCVILELGLEHRIELLMQDYAHFSQDSNSFITRLNTLTQSIGKKQIESWSELVQQAQTPQVVKELLQLHYDPIYVSSSQRNFLQYKNANTYRLEGLEASELARVAGEVALAN